MRLRVAALPLALLCSAVASISLAQPAPRGPRALAEAARLHDAVHVQMDAGHYAEAQALAERELERRVSDRSAAYHAEQRPITVESVQARVAAGSALVEVFVRHPGGTPAGEQKPARFASIALGLLVARRAARWSNTTRSSYSTADGGDHGLR